MRTPKLRFPEFQDAGEWEEEDLGAISNNISSGKDKNDPNGVHDLFGSTGVIGKTSSDTYNGKFLLVARVGANAGLLTKANGKFGVTDNTLVIHLKKTAWIDFFFYYLDNLNLNKLIFGSGQPLITGGQLKALSLYLPSDVEQQKIADCLSSLDELINAQAQKLDMLKAHKKGLMQQLFPAEGENLPILRFPEFRNAGEWEEYFGNDLFEQISDRNPDPYLPVLAITQESGAIPRDAINYHVSVTEKSIESYKVVQVGDFIISLRSFQGGIEHSSYHGICSPAYVILRRLIKGSDIYFKQYFKTDRFIRLLTKNLEGLRDGKMISYKQFSELLLPVPKSAEQQKIAECLSSLDEMIRAQTQKLDSLKAYKKGLMQQLFPALDEVRE